MKKAIKNKAEKAEEIRKLIEKLSRNHSSRGEKHGRIDTIEISPSSKARCHDCRNKVMKGTPRLTFIMSWRKNIKDKSSGKVVDWIIPIKRAICYKCAMKRLQRDIDKEKEEINKLRSVKRKFLTQMKKPEIQELIRNNEIMNELEK